MWIMVDPRSHTPMYQQIIDDIKTRIARGAMASGSKLPSIRELAMDITINPNTIAKAYQELEREGVIEVIRGKGTFVASSTPAEVRDSARRVVRDMLTRTLVEAHHLGVEFIDVGKELERLIADWNQAREGQA